MQTLLEVALSNAVVATLLGLVAAVVGLLIRRPAVEHGVWVVTLAKLLSPPVLILPLLAWSPWQMPRSEDSIPVHRAESDDGSAIALELKAPRVADGFRGRREEALVAAAGPIPFGQLQDLASRSSPPPATKHPHVERADRPRDLSEGISGRSYLPLLLFGWGIGAVWCLISAGVCVWRFQKLLARAERAPFSIQHNTAHLARRLALRRAPEVLLVPGSQSPMIWGIGRRAKLLIPVRLLAHLDNKQLQTILVHELAHLQRRDHWVRWLELFCRTVYWWHPIVWWGGRRIRDLEEQACDALVISMLPNSRESYASALLDTVDFISGARPAVPLMATGIGHSAFLKRRLTMIMRGTTSSSLTLSGRLAIAVVGVSLLPWAPTFSQSEDAAQDPVLRGELAPRVAQRETREDAERRVTRLTNQIGQLLINGQAEEANALAAEVREMRRRLQDRASESSAPVRAADPARDRPSDERRPRADRDREQRLQDTYRRLQDRFRLQQERFQRAQERLRREQNEFQRAQESLTREQQQLHEHEHEHGDARAAFQEELHEELHRAEEEIHQAQEHIHESVEQIREEIEQVISEAPEVALDAIQDVNVKVILDEAIKSIPEVLRQSVGDLDIEVEIQEGLRRVAERGRRRGTLSKEDIEEMMRELDEEVREAAEELSDEARDAVDDARSEVSEALREAAKLMQRSDIQEVVEQELSSASESVRQLLREMNVEEVIDSAVGESVRAAERIRDDAIEVSGDALERGGEAVLRAARESAQATERRRQRSSSRTEAAEDRGLERRVSRLESEIARLLDELRALRNDLNDEETREE